MDNQNKNSSLLFLAFVLSRLTGPFTVMPLIVIGVLYVSVGEEILGNSVILWSLFIGYFLVPTVWFGYLLKTKKVGDIDITERAERNQLMNLTIVSWWCGFVVATSQGLSEPLLATFLYINCVLTILTMITNKFKVSLHAAGFVTTYVIVNFLFGYGIWWSILLLGLVFWSRLYQKKHTWSQLVLGSVMPVLIGLVLGIVL